MSGSPAGDRARTSNRCAPASRLPKTLGDLHSAYGPPSMLHSKPWAFGPDASKVKRAPRATVREGGPETMTVSGAGAGSVVVASWSGGAWGTLSWSPGVASQCFVTL